MKLFIYLKKNKITLRGFAKTLGINPATLSNIANKHTSASLKVAVKIMAIADDDEFLLDLLSDEDEKEVLEFYKKHNMGKKTKFNQTNCSIKIDRHDN